MLRRQGEGFRNERNGGRTTDAPMLRPRRVLPCHFAVESSHADGGPAPIVRHRDTESRDLFQPVRLHPTSERA